MKKRKPAEPRIWMAVSVITDLATGKAYPQANLSRHAHKTKNAGINDIKHDLGIAYPSEKYKWEIIDAIGVKWDYLTKAFAYFFDSDDDDDRGSDDAPAVDPDPEDHGVERVEVPESFVSFINDLRLPDPV